MLRFKEMKVLGCLLLVLSVAAGCGSGGSGGGVSTTTITGQVTYNGANKINTSIALYKYINGSYQSVGEDTTTDPGGTFIFTGVTNGSYYIIIDQEGVPPYNMLLYYPLEAINISIDQINQPYNFIINLQVETGGFTGTGNLPPPIPEG